MLYDIGHQDGIDFLVMEYLEGETLTHRLERGALPVAELLRIGIDVADAFDKSHRQGVVHRDLKPGNIMLTKPGAKMLDFGLESSLNDHRLCLAERDSKFTGSHSRAQHTLYPSGKFIRRSKSSKRGSDRSRSR
jgi:serine/threonine protein kinase